MAATGSGARSCKTLCMAWRNRIEVSYGILRQNVAAIMRAANGRGVIAVIKADAYGLGQERCARIYHRAGAAALAVACLSEADRVRDTVPDARVLILGSPLPEERQAVVASGYDVHVSSLNEVDEFARLASPKAPLNVHVNIDTGMGRLGVVPDEAVTVIEQVQAAPSLRLAGIATHYPMATDAEVSTAQEQILAAILQRVAPLPVDCWIHMANSEGVLMRPIGAATHVRVGLLLTGVVPQDCPDPGVTVPIRWLSSLNLVKRLPAGHGIGYLHMHTLTRDSVVAVVPVGYADGYPIALSGRGASVLVSGQRCPVLGRVTMDYIVIDVTDCEHIPAPGEGVVLIGRQSGESITVTELADRAGTIPYDLLCGFRGRCEVVGVP